MPLATKPAKLRVVLDTNVLVSAHHFSSGAVAILWEALGKGRYLLVSSPAIVREFAAILRRPFGWEEANVERAVRLLARKAMFVNPTNLPAAVPDDPDDNHVLACAVAGRADLIVTGDKDLLRIKEYQGIPIVRTMDFVRTVGGPSNEGK